ncbi:VOC family protein [Salinicoccus roseus]|uniref:Glyoxalase n=1 Tax=Salinicoccus roseus TaxID=45670 RepID=A0A0C2E382_9STAP|nr:VOC family protein [Salinicoccus roseus]KIH69902.1 glyoxalase [Salinicoccus roseus]MDB0581189.1 VOC family protein [Salinicoccus roseus]
MNFHKSPATHVAHVKINVSDMKEALNFYTGLLGFKVLEQNGKDVQLTADDKTSILSLHEPENAIEKKRTSGLYHFAILLPERADLAAITIHLAKNDVRLGASDHLVSEALYLNDPDGNGIEIYRDREPEEWSWNGPRVEMTTDPLDFENLVESLEEGQEWQGMPEGTVMGHLHLHVSDMPSAVKFYTEGLGLKVVAEFPGQAAFMSSEDYHHHIAVNVWNGIGAPQPEPGSVGLNEFIMNYPDEASLNAAAKRLEDLGHEVISKDGTTVSYDPSGNKAILTTE